MARNLLPQTLDQKLGGLVATYCGWEEMKAWCRAITLSSEFQAQIDQTGSEAVQDFPGLHGAEAFNLSA